MDVRLEHKVGERVLGNDPATGKPVSVKIGRFGPMIQLGDGEAEEKPQFASLLKGSRSRPSPSTKLSSSSHSPK